jgi:dCMP deaminase
MSDLPDELKECILGDYTDYTPPTWDVLFMRMAYEAAAKSKDTKTKIGAFIVGPNNEPISFGYNGIPRKVDDSIADRYERPKKYLFFEHAERNAIYTLPRIGATIPKGSTMYTNGTPCADCGRGIIQAGISNVVIHEPFELISRHLYDNWAESSDITREMFKEAGVTLRSLTTFINVYGFVNGKVIKV